MKFPIPSFVPVPSAEVMQIISILSLTAGICITTAGVLFLLRNRRKQKENSTPAWILICTGALLIANHSLQLIF